MDSVAESPQHCLLDVVRLSAAPTASSTCSGRVSSRPAPEASRALRRRCEADILARVSAGIVLPVIAAAMAARCSAESLRLVSAAAIFARCSGVAGSFRGLGLPL